MEVELDRNEIIIRMTQEELIGESLLSAEYAENKANKFKNGSEFLAESTILSRPITPQQLRQSLLIQQSQSTASNKAKSAVVTNGKANRTNQSMIVKDSGQSKPTNNKAVSNSTVGSVGRSSSASNGKANNNNKPPMNNRSPNRQTTTTNNNNNQQFNGTFEFNVSGNTTNQPNNSNNSPNKSTLNRTASQKQTTTTKGKHANGNSKTVNILTIDHSMDEMAHNNHETNNQVSMDEDSIYLSKVNSTTNKTITLSTNGHHASEKHYEDEFIEEDYEDDEAIRGEKQQQPPNGKVNTSINAFKNKPKIQRTPVQSMALNVPIKQGISSIDKSTNYMPKYSIAEPRPSSANSIKSKDSSNSATLNGNNK